MKIGKNVFKRLFILEIKAECISMTLIGRHRSQGHFSKKKALLITSIDDLKLCEDVISLQA